MLRGCAPEKQMSWGSFYYIVSKVRKIAVPGYLVFQVEWSELGNLFQTGKGERGHVCGSLKCDLSLKAAFIS